VCTGSLGDNIFAAGDFGSGAANIRLPNPQIAPDYLYSSTIQPPADGSYVLTNSTSVWPGLFPTWLRIGDNSEDPNGYMMVVNASFEPGLFYDQEVSNLCDNTLYEFTADIINLIRPGVTGHIDPSVSFLIDGVVQFNTGNIPKSAEWETYGFTFTTAPGQTSVRLSLRNNAPGGIGNDLALDNISFRPCGNQAFILPEDTAILCEDGSPLPLFATVDGDEFTRGSIQWQRSPDGINDWENIPEANDSVYVHTDLRLGFYYYRFQIAGSPLSLANPKCRINSNVKIVHVRAKEYYLTDTICAGMEVTVGPSIYSVTGVYTDSLINAYGCDSIVVLDLTVLPDPGMIAGFAFTAADCFNTAAGAIEIISVVNGIGPYRYQFEDRPPGAGAVFRDLPGDSSYRFRITDLNGCTLDTLVYLPAPPTLTLDLGPDQTLLLGDRVRLPARTNFVPASYRWSSSAATENLPCGTSSSCDELEWFPAVSQFVYLSVEDEQGCALLDSVYLSVTAVREVYIPNVFSPNRDGLNDVFTAYGPSPRISSIARLQVLDRWGNLVFDGRELAPGAFSDGWDGTVSGKLAPPGVYVYLLEVRFLDGVVQTYSGDVTLLR
jgi:gliding motility-associated-like protein